MKRLITFAAYVLFLGTTICPAAPRTASEQLLRVGAWNAAANIPVSAAAPNAIH